MNTKYQLDDTVIVTDWLYKPLGIIKKIHVTKEKTKYSVRVSPTAICIFEEKSLVPSKIKIHEDDYQVKKDQKIKVKGKSYLVEEAKEEHFFVKTFHDGPTGDKAYVIKARSLTNGKLSLLEQIGLNEFRKFERKNVLNEEEMNSFTRIPIPSFE